MTVEIGFTIINAVSATPTHSLKVGVTLIVATCGFNPKFSTMNGVMFPFPLGSKLMDTLSFVH